MLKGKSLVAVLLVAIMMLTLFVGCSQTTDTPDASDGKDTPAQTDDEKTGDEASSDDGWEYVMGGPVSPENVTIKFLTHSGHGSTLAIPNRDLPVYQEIEKRLGVTFDWQILDNNEYNSLVNIRLMSDDLPDLVVMLNRADADKLVEDDFFWAFDDLDMDKNAPYTKILLQDPKWSYLDDIWRSLYDDGKIYAFGNTVIERMLFCNLIVNVHWLRNNDMEEPSTLEEFADMLKFFRDNDMNGNGQKDEIPLADTPVELRFALGHPFSLDINSGWSLDDDGNIVYEYATEKYKDYLIYRRMLYQENLIDKENRGMTEYYELVGQDRLGCVAYYATFQGTINSYSPLYKPPDEYVVFRELLPLVNKYTGKRQMYSRLSSGVGEGTYILKNTEHPEVCLRILDWLYSSEEYEILMNFGIEGMSFEYDEDGIPRRIQPDDYDGPVAYLTYIGGSQPPWTHRQSEFAWRVRHGELPWVMERVEEMQQYYIDGIRPFVFNAVETDEYNKYRTEVETYRDEMTAAFIEGRASIEDEFDDYVAQIYKLGLDKMTELHQKKYDELYK